LWQQVEGSLYLPKQRQPASERSHAQAKSSGRFEGVPKGKKLGRIVHGQPATTNIGFGGEDWKTLFFTSRTMMGSVNVKIPGIPVPVAKKA
jgi:hypothetical protein